MRAAGKAQPTLREPWLDSPHAKELEAISNLLDEHPDLSAMVARDVGGGSSQRVVTQGMSGEQVLRALIIKQMNQLSYEDLAFFIADSSSYRTFCRIGLTDQPPSKSTLAENIKRIKPGTLEQLNRRLLSIAKEQGVENGRKVRVDCTTVETNIHEPSDSSLLWDCVRVLTRLMQHAREEVGPSIAFPNRTRRAKRRMMNIQYAKTNKRREAPYRDLVKITAEVCRSAERVAAHLRVFEAADLMQALKVQALADEIQLFLARTDRVVEQTRRRVIDGEKVPACDKIVSIFEDHTDIIVKGSRDVGYGHKICLSGGTSSMILDCLVVEGNPADSTLAPTMIERLTEIQGKAPRQAAFDGGFASLNNLADIKNMGVKDVMFSKRRGLEISEMVRSTWVYKRLRNFRAGIEASISFLKRVFGLGRCTWRSFQSFKSYVWGSIVSLNLLVLARHILQ
jgi:IS5 family transposase